MASREETLPELPYGYDELEPVISKEIMELHHKKHHQGYVNNLNDALKKYRAAEDQGDIEQMIELQSAIKFNGGGHVNHSIFWTNLAPVSKGGGGTPSGDLAKAIDQDFGSFENFKEKFNKKTAAVQGSGWGWLCYCPCAQKLCICTRQNQDPCAIDGSVPLFGVDVWEHAYYLQYKNVRPEYLKNIWQIVNWSNVAERFARAAG